MDPFDKSFDITVDVLIPASSYSYEEVEFSQTDENTSLLNISITKKGRNLDVTNATILVAFQKSDNTFVYQDTTSGVTVLDAANGKISIELNAQVLSLSGKVNGEILITYPTNKSITSKPFYFLVDASIFEGMGNTSSSPNDVTGLTTNNVTSTSLALSWSVSSGATSYDVYNGSTLLANVATTTYNVSGLTASTPYTFKVIAKNSAGSAPGTGVGSSLTVTTLVLAPSDVTGLTATNITQTTLTLTWTASATATTYDVFENNTLLTNLTAITYNVTGLMAGTQYTFKVIAKNAGGSASGTGSGATTTITTTASTAVVGSATVGSATVA